MLHSGANFLWKEPFIQNLTRQRKRKVATWRKWDGMQMLDDKMVRWRKVRWLELTKKVVLYSTVYSVQSPVYRYTAVYIRLHQDT